ncbi:MFS transporter [Chroococcidiopsis sp.]|uniref:MFS transporter n=1 Tax=Chroococcidiopsis sp. TaxID=3088168 RepID=UPI003F2C83F1
MQTEIIKLPSSLRAFKSRNYRLFFIGQGLSLIGTWMTQIATIWLVYQLTNSALLLGVIGFVSQAPSLILAPFTGFLADRWNRHRLLIVTQALAMLRSLVLAILTLTGQVNIWHLLILSIIQSLINSFDMPIRQAFVPEMVGIKADLDNAIALNSSLTSSARLLGPAIAGLLIAAAGAGACFLIDSISYVAIIAALLAMKVTPGQTIAETTSPWQELQAGFTYVFSSLPIRSVLLLLVLVSFLGMPYISLGPIFAKEVLQGGSDTFGFLMTTAGIGALLGAVYLSFRNSVRGLEKLVFLLPTVLGIGIITFSLSPILWLSLLLIFFIGFVLAILNAGSNTILQMLVEDNKRGRVMSLYTMASTGMLPLGNLFAGGLASQIGVQNALIINGIFCITISLVFANRVAVVGYAVNQVMKN